MYFLSQFLASSSERKEKTIMLSMTVILHGLGDIEVTEFSVGVFEIEREVLRFDV